MQTYEIQVKDRIITATGDTTMVRTSVGVDRLHITFDSKEWLDFDLTLAFVNISITEVEVTPTETTDGCEATCDVPSEALTVAGPLGITVYGTDENDDYIITAASVPFTVLQEGEGDPLPPPSPHLDVVAVNATGSPKREYVTDSSYEIYWNLASEVRNFVYSDQGVIVDSHGLPVKVKIMTSDQSSAAYVAVGTCADGSTVAGIPVSRAEYDTQRGTVTLTPSSDYPLVFAKVSSARAYFAANIKFELA